MLGQRFGVVRTIGVNSIFTNRIKFRNSSSRGVVVVTIELCGLIILYGYKNIKSSILP